MRITYYLVRRDGSLTVASDVSVLAGGATAALGAVGAVSIGVAEVRRRHRLPFLISGHALARPQDTDPLPAALRRGLSGLTVPVRPGPHGELFLGPGLPQPGRTLRRLVLSPLFARARGGDGRLRPDQRIPFRLVVEFVGPHRDAETLLRAYRMLNRQLFDHAELLSSWTDGALEPGAVTVVVSGIVDARELLAAQRRRYAFADGAFEDIGLESAPPDLVPMISEPWSRRFGWDGREEISAEERHLLHAMIASAHDDGRLVQISGLPSGSRRARRAIWDELCSAGVDVIADADQSGLARYLRRHPLRRPELDPPVQPPRHRPPVPRPEKIATNPAEEVTVR
jgi:hypothetical protein